jgi:hypothetical protein
MNLSVSEGFLSGLQWARESSLQQGAIKPSCMESDRRVRVPH